MHTEIAERNLKMFSSKKAEVSYDRFPYVSHTGSRHEFAGTFEGKQLTYEPRSPQKKTQNNAPNPALVEAREHIEATPEAHRKAMLKVKIYSLKALIEDHTHTWRRMDDQALAYAIHARNVLTRVQRLGESNE